MNADIAATITKTGTAGAKTAVNVMYTVTRQLVDLAYPTTSGRAMDVDAAGGVEVGSFQAGAITAAAFTAGAIDAAAIATDAIGAAELADGAITAATFAAGAIDAAAIATNAIDADAIAADALPELRGAVATGTSDAGGSTTTMVDAALTQGDDYWNDMVILFTSGAIVGQSRLITDFVAATDTLSFEPAVAASVGAGFTYEILPGARADVQMWLGSLVNALLSGRVDVSLGATQTGAIVAAAFAAGAIDAAAIATDAIGSAEFAQAAADKIWASTTRTLSALGFVLAAADIGADAIGASELAADAANEIADAIFTRATSNWEATAPVKSLGAAVMKAVHRVRDNAGTLEIYRSNGTTVHASQTITTDVLNAPIDELTGAV